MDYTLFGKKFKVSEARKLLIRIKNICDLMADGIDDDFEKEYKNRVSSIEGTIKNSYQIAEDVLRPRVKQLIDFYFSYRIYDITAEQICKEILDDGSFENHRILIKERYDEIREIAAEEKEMREERKESRGRWEGGGFGMSNAIKGAAQAGALNMASGAAHSIFNAIGNMGTEMRMNSSLSDLYSSPSTLNGLAKGLWLDVTNYFITVGELLEEDYGEEIEWVYKSQSEKAENMYQNISSVSAESTRREMLFEMVELNPFESEYYKYIFVNNNAAIKKEVVKLAECFGADITDEVFDYAYDGIKEKVSLEIALKQREEVAKRLGAIGKTEDIYFEQIDRIVYNSTMQDFKDKIKKCKTVAEVEKVGEDVSKSILETADKTKLDKEIKEKIKALCTYQDILFPSQEEAQKQQKLFDGFEAKIKGSNTVELLIDLNDELNKSELHKDLIDKHEKTIVDKRIKVERENLKTIVPKDLNTLKAEELDSIKENVLKMNLYKSLECEILNKIKDSKEYVINEAEYNTYKEFYNSNGINYDVPAVLTAAEFYLDKYLSSNSELKNLFLSVISKDVKSIFSVAEAAKEIVDVTFVDKGILAKEDIRIHTTENITTERSELLSKLQCNELPLVLVKSPKFELLYTTLRLFIKREATKEFVVSLCNDYNVIEDTSFLSSDIKFTAGLQSCIITTGSKKARKELYAFISTVKSEFKSYTQSIYSEIDIANFVKVLHIYKKYNVFTDGVESIFKVTLDNEAEGFVNKYTINLLGEILRKKNGDEIDAIAATYESIKSDIGKSNASVEELLAKSKNDFIGEKLTFNNVVYNTEAEKIAAEEKYNFLESVVNSSKAEDFKTILEAFEKIGKSSYSYDECKDYTNRLFDDLYVAAEMAEFEVKLQEILDTISSAAVLKGFEQTEDVVNKITLKIQSLDEQRRTYRGVVFDASADIMTAQTEEKQMDIIMANVYKDDIQSINNARQQINAFSSKIKEVYLAQLDEYAKVYEEGLRTYRGVVYDSVETASIAKEEYVKAREIMTMLDKTNERAVNDAYAFVTSLKYADLTEYKNTLEELLHHFDVINRTVDEILFETIEEANKAREELAIVMTVMPTLNMAVEQTLIAGKENLVKLETAVKHKYVEQVEKMLVQYDINVRTFNGVTYDTREMANLVRKEYDYAVACMAEVSMDNEESILNAQKKMLGLTTHIKDGFVDQLKKMWEEYDLKVRTYDGIVFETRVQAHNAYVTQNEFYKMYYGMNLLVRENVRVLENYVEDELQEQLKPKTQKLVDELIYICGEYEWIIRENSIVDPATNKKESAEIHKRVEKLIPRMEACKISTAEIMAIKERHYGSLNAGQKVLSFFKSKF